MKRRKFITHSSQFGIAISLMGVYACKEATKGELNTATAPVVADVAPFFKLSLAQWSIHKMIWEGRDPYTFAELAKNWGFSGLEYVSQLYDKELEPTGYAEEAMAKFVEKSNAEAKKHGLNNVLIMIDGQGDLATEDALERKKAVENHFKWVDAAASMGCHAIRVNLSGSTEPAAWQTSSVDGLTQLASYAKEKNINVLVENHGGLSSNAAMLAEVMEKVNMPNCGTLPDFGNFCIRRNDANDWASGCAEKYDIYKGVKELMVHAKAVSAKSNNFDANGNEVVIDYVKMLQIVKDAGYTGYVGVEYEGEELGEEAGIIATKELLIKVAKKLS